MNPVGLEAGGEFQQVECEYIGHRKVRVSMTDREAAGLLGIAFAGTPDHARGDDLPSLVRRRSARVGLRKLLVARDRARVRFWNRVHVGHVALQDLDPAYQARLGRERIHLSLTLEQAHAMWSYGESGRLRRPALPAQAAGQADGSEAHEAAERALEKIQNRIREAHQKHRETNTSKEWVWSSCNDPVTWLPEKIAREKLHPSPAECNP